MGAIGRLLAKFGSTLFRPFRLLTRLFFRSSGSKALTTVRKAVGNAAAADAPTVEEVSELPKPTKGAFFFRAIDRPKLTEGSAAELSLEVAREFVGRAHRFYTNQFDLFPQGHFFYEEIELSELTHALAADDPRSTDARFVLWMDTFRQTLNDNARRLLLFMAPLVFTLTMVAALLIAHGVPEIAVPVMGDMVRTAYVSIPAGATFALLIMALIYQWPFKVIIQRNLLGLDNYITSRFSRINQNFQVAKRHALNVERNKRMSQSAELKNEAGVWTVAYNWFAIRLFLCERIVRNQMYQINRNATLYAMGGVSVCIAIALVLGAGWRAMMGTDVVDMNSLGILAASAAVFIAINYAFVVGQAPGEPRRVLQDNEWFRFGGAELDRTIADHVGEDKLQIVTFRDRNRME